MAWFDDPVELASKGRDRPFRRTRRRVGGRGAGQREGRVEPRIPVFTANKALLAHHGVELAKLAQKKGATIFFEAAAAGGIPIIKTMREALRGNACIASTHPQRHLQLHAHPHGEGRDRFEDCLKDAQRLGYAEADPTFDIGGFDAAHKLALLTSLAFGCEIDLDSIFSRASRTSPTPISRRPLNSAIASSSWPLPSAPRAASSSGSTPR